MSPSFPPEIRELVAAQMATGRFATEEDVLLDALLQQQQQESVGEFQDDWPAIQEAFDDIKAGDQGISIDAAFAQARKAVDGISE